MRITLGCQSTSDPVSAGQRAAFRAVLLLILLGLCLSALPRALAAPGPQPATPTPASLPDHGLGEATALGAGTISLSPSSSTILLGQTVNVDVWISDVTDLYGMDFRICFDNAVASVPSNNASLLWEVFDQFNNFVVRNGVYNANETYCPCSAIPGCRWYWYSVTQTDDPFNPGFPLPFSGSGRFATLTFRGDSVGTTALHFCYVKGSTKGGVGIFPTITDGSITVADGRVGNLVWNDLDRDGFQDLGEPGVDGVTVRLLDGTGSSVLQSTTTAGGGLYQFTGLKVGTYMVEFVLPANHIFTRYNFDGLGITGTVNSDASRSTGRTVAFAVNSPSPIAYVDAGLVESPTIAGIFGVDAYYDLDGVMVTWQTSAEASTVGFNVLRLDEATGAFVQVNERLLPGLGVAQGGAYSCLDRTASSGVTLTYLIEEVEANGMSQLHGPYELKADSGGPRPMGVAAAVPRAPSHSYADRLRAATERDDWTASPENRLATGHRPDTIKLTVDAEGLYFVSADSIAVELGVDAGEVKRWLNEGTLKLTSQERDVAYLAAPNRSGLYFYGVGSDSLYGRSNVYWLRRGEAVHMDVVRGKVPKPGAASGSFVQTLHLEEDRLAIPAAFSDPQADYWMWHSIWSGYPQEAAKTIEFPAVGIARGAATLVIHLLGQSDSPAALDHHAVVSLNGREVGQARWSGTEPQDLSISVDAGWLIDGGNELVIEGVLDEGVPYSAFYVDSLELAYPRWYRAVDDVLLLTGDGNDVITVDGFSRSTIWVLNVSDPFEPTLVEAAKVLRRERGRYQVVFAPESERSKYLVLTPDRALVPDGMEADREGDLRSPDNAAEYIIITPAALEPAAATLAAYRETEGLTVRMVLIEDVYDEFNQGLPSPMAIRTFLAFAHDNWQVPPRWVLLAGKGSYDYRDNLGLGGNLIPVWMVPTPRGLYPSDNRLADFVGDDGLPDVAIGRLPVLSNDELVAVVAKIVSFEEDSGGGAPDRALLLADDADEGGDFAADSRRVGAHLPAQIQPAVLALDEVDLSTLRARLFSALQEGVLFLNYLGHAGLDRLAQEGLLTAADIPALDNGPRLPLVALMTCAAGQFAIPGYSSIAEDLVVEPNAGAVAVWAPTGWSLNDQARTLDEQFVQEVFAGSEQRLGDAVVRTLDTYAAEGGALFMIDIYNLLGDPALLIK